MLHACHHGHLDVVRYLVKELYVDPTCPDNVGDAALIYAAAGGQTKVVAFLISEEL